MCRMSEVPCVISKQNKNSFSFLIITVQIHYLFFLIIHHYFSKKMDDIFILFKNYYYSVCIVINLFTYFCIYQLTILTFRIKKNYIYKKDSNGELLPAPSCDPFQAVFHISLYNLTIFYFKWPLTAVRITGDSTYIRYSVFLPA